MDISLVNWELLFPNEITIGVWELEEKDILAMSDVVGQILLTFEEISIVGIALWSNSMGYDRWGGANRK